MCIKLIKGVLAVVALAGAVLVTGCSNCAPVREEIITTTSAYPAPVAELETVEMAPALDACATGGIY